MSEEKKTGKIFQALQKVNDDIIAIKKDQRGFNYNFRGIDDVLNTLGPLFKKHKIFVRRVKAEITKFPEAKDQKGNPVNHFLLNAIYEFMSTEDGSAVFSAGFGEGMDKGDKAIGCATSNAYKYVIFEMFNIPTAEQIDSDQKTAKENNVEAPKKEAKKEVKKDPKANFRRKKVDTKEEPKEEKKEAPKRTRRAKKTDEGL